MPQNKADIQEVKRALERKTTELRNYLGKLANEQWQEIAQEEPVRMTVEQYIYSLLEHEIEHHGLILWILNRYTKWDDNAMYQVIL
jgi:hypothetical protein